MNYKIRKSNALNIDDAILEVSEGLKSPKLIFFSSSINSFEEYSRKLKYKFKESTIIGSTSYVGLCKEGAFKNSLLLIGIESGIECSGNVLEDADSYPFKYVERISNCLNEINDLSNTVCFEISSALKSCEELVMSTFNSVLDDKNIPLFGGSSGDSGNAEKALISFNGNVYDNACAFVFIKNLGGKIRLYRENIYKKTNHYFTATKVDFRQRIVYEYDNRPAAEVMSEMLNTTISELPQYLDSHPLGRIIGDDMYTVANQKIVENNAMAYHARIYTNSKMVLLEPNNYKDVVTKTIEKIKREVPSPSLAIMINCLAISNLYENDGYLDDFAKDMGTALGDYIGFSGYG